jgi:GT2 family glycosyltransferase
MEIELVILNYNGIEHLTHLLPTATAEALSFPSVKITVLDNRSTENDAGWVRANYPDVKFVQAPSNDYLFSYNWYAARSKAEILIFLNNDLKLKPNFIRPLVSHFSSNDIFSVSATSRNWNDTEYSFGPIQLRHHHGDFYWNPDFSKQEAGLTLFTSGGFMAVDQHKFLEIGGFDRIYHPAYCEDLDLCFRAWKKGWRCIFEPKSIVLHRENGSWAKSGNERAKYLQARARWLFIWKNLPPACGFAERVTYNLLQFARSLVNGEIWVLRARADAQKIWWNLPRHSKRDRVSLEFIDSLGKPPIY